MKAGSEQDEKIRDLGMRNAKVLYNMFVSLTSTLKGIRSKRIRKHYISATRIPPGRLSKNGCYALKRILLLVVPRVLLMTFFVQT